MASINGSNGRESARGGLLQEQMTDYLIALAEALSIPPAGTEAAEIIYYQLLGERVIAAVASLRVALEQGLNRTLPEETTSLRTRITELPTDTYQHASDNWRFNPARPRARIGGEELQALVTEFLTALLELLDVPAPAGSPPHRWLLEDRVVAAEIAMTMVCGSDLDQSLPEETVYLRERLSELRRARY
jgi:hypothetical protein